MLGYTAQPGGVPRLGESDKLFELRNAVGRKLLASICRAAVRERAHKLLSDAGRVCFLGFGYDGTNLERLAGYTPSRSQVVIGSAKGFSTRECHLIGESLTKLGFPFPASSATLNSLELNPSGGGLHFPFRRPSETAAQVFRV